MKNKTISINASTCNNNNNNSADSTTNTLSNKPLKNINDANKINSLISKFNSISNNNNNNIQKKNLHIIAVRNNNASLSCSNEINGNSHTTTPSTWDHSSSLATSSNSLFSGLCSIQTH